MVHLRVHQSFRWRLGFLAAFFVALLAAVLVRIFNLAIVDHRQFVLAAERQHRFAEVLPSRRGTIYARDKSGTLQPLATQKSFYTIIAVPLQVTSPDTTAASLASVLSLSAPEILGKLAKREDPYEVIARKVDEDVAARVRSLNAEGIVLLEEPRRIYPQGSLAASLLGFVTYRDGSEAGEYGIEKQYDSFLRGERGFFEADKDASGYWIALGRRILNPPVNGDAIVLTIDPNIQFRLEEELGRLMEKWQGELALGVVLEPKTGRVLAMASQPTFDPNQYSRETDFSVFRNPVVNSQFELGSVMKPITMSAGIDTGVITPQTTYDDPGSRRIDGFTISNYDGLSHGVQTMTQVLEKSLNTGAIFVAERLGKAKFREFLERFGFGQVSGIDFPGELPGNTSHLAQGRAADYATASYGQGLAVTPLQVVSAIGAIANHGVMMRPYLVEKITDAAGNEEVRGPVEVRRVLSPETAEAVTKMLVSVVRNGFDNRGGVRGYFVAGKTGTAQIPKQTGRGYSDESIHTVIGYAPAFDPRFVILLEITKPKGVRFASSSLTPSFRNLSEFILRYYDVPPDETSGAKGAMGKE